MELCIAYEVAGKVSIVHPVPLARLCSHVRVGDGDGFLHSQRVPLCQLIGRSTLPDDLVVAEGETDQEFAARIAARTLEPGQEWHAVRVSELPSRDSRDRWKLVGGKVVSDG